MTISFIIILYNSQLSNSITLNSLLPYIKTNYDVCIWNNGPFSLVDEFENSVQYQSLIEQGLSITFLEDLSNAPLSIIYNKFINEKRESQYFVILDDDTKLTASYIETLDSQQGIVDLILPHITDMETGKLVAPTDKGKVVLNDGTMSLDKPGSVSSGIVIGQRLVKLVKKYYANTVFDENYALYGIDSTFLMRIKKINKKEKIYAISQGNLLHSLSYSLDENENIKSFRSKELSYDKALTLRHYFSFGKLKTFLRDYKKIAKGKSLLTRKEILYCLWKGKHPRCIKYTEKN